MDTDKLTEALAKAQAEIQSPARNREVVVRTKTGHTYTFKYATLDAIIDCVRAPLTKNGLWFTQVLEGGEDGRFRLVTRLMHESGQSIESTTPLFVTGNDSQAFGSALTYMRRYSLSAMLGVAGDEDDDGNHACGNVATDTNDTAEQKQKPKASKPRPAKKTEDQPDGYEKIMGEGLNYIGKVHSATDADAMLNILNGYTHVGDSKKDLWKALCDRAKVLGITFDRSSGKFKEKDSADNNQERQGGSEGEQTGTEAAA